MSHVPLETLRGCVDPWVGAVWDAVELQDDGLSLSGLGQDALEMLESPIRVGVAGGRNQQGMMFVRVKRRTHLQFAVLDFRGQTAPCKPEAGVAQDAKCFGPETVTAVGETHRTRYTHFFELVLGQREFAG